MELSRLSSKEVLPGEDPLAGARRRVAQLYQELDLTEALTVPASDIDLTSTVTGHDRTTMSFDSPDTRHVDPQLVSAAIAGAFRNPTL